MTSGWGPFNQPRNKTIPVRGHSTTTWTEFCHFWTLVTPLTALPPNWVPQWYHGTGSSDIWDPAGSDIRYHLGPFQSDEIIEFDSMSSQTKSIGLSTSSYFEFLV